MKVSKGDAGKEKTVKAGEEGDFLDYSDFIEGYHAYGYNAPLATMLLGLQCSSCYNATRLPGYRATGYEEQEKDRKNRKILVCHVYWEKKKFFTMVVRVIK